MQIEISEQTAQVIATILGQTNIPILDKNSEAVCASAKDFLAAIEAASQKEKQATIK